MKNNFPQFKSDSSLIYLDSAATTLVPTVVIDALAEYYKEYPANIHRGMYDMSAKATQKYEEAREVIANFIGADTNEVVFTSGTTEGINTLASSLQETLEAGDNIVLTRYEHHANLIPWQEAAKKMGAELRFIELTEDFTLDLNSAKKLIDDKTKIVSFGFVSNTLGTIANVKELIALAKKHEAITIIDAAQAVAHMKVDVKELDCDAFVFSGHKMYGPKGIGVLYAKTNFLKNLSPFKTGGAMIKEVSYEKATWAEAPHKFEAGTPNIGGAIGLAAAVKFLEEAGWKKITSHEAERVDYLLNKLSADEALTVIGPASAENRGGVFSFTYGDIHPHDLADMLGQKGIAVRAGHHCTEPLMKHLGLVGTVRVSLGIYNTKEDIDALMSALKEIKETWKLK